MEETIGDPLFLWIDQLCVDQANDHERNHQITLMASIYQTAAMVIAWLADPSPNRSSEAIQLLQHGLDILHTHREAYEQSDYKCVDRHSVIYHALGMKHDVGAFMVEQAAALYLEGYLVHSNGRQIEGLDELLQDIILNPYWTRIWIRQEVLLNARTQIIFGRLVGWMQDIATLLYLGGPKKSTEGLLTPRQSPSDRKDSSEQDPWRRWRSFYSERLPLLNYSLKFSDNSLSEIMETLGRPCSSEALQRDIATVLERWGNGECLDIRDKVCGLHALIKNNTHIRPRYDFDAEAVFIQALEFQCLHGNRVQTLRDVLDFAAPLLDKLQLTIDQVRSFVIQNRSSCDNDPTLARMLARAQHGYEVKVTVFTDTFWDQAGYTILWFVPPTLERVVNGEVSPWFLADDRVWCHDYGRESFYLVLRELVQDDIKAGVIYDVHLAGFGLAEERSWVTPYLMPSLSFFPVPDFLHRVLLRVPEDGDIPRTAISQKMASPHLSPWFLKLMSPIHCTITRHRDLS